MVHETTSKFGGQYLCKLDEKGRFVVPSPIREHLEADGSTVVFFKGQDQPLYAYSTSAWQDVLERAKTNLAEEVSRLFMHYMVAEASPSDMDKAGRILIPGRLRKIIPVDNDQEVVLVGMYHRLEIWNPAEWRHYLLKNDQTYEQNISKMLSIL